MIISDDVGDVTRRDSYDDVMKCRLFSGTRVT